MNLLQDKFITGLSEVSGCSREMLMGGPPPVSDRERREAKKYFTTVRSTHKGAARRARQARNRFHKKFLRKA